jgi:probable F420-dependent oxidoreductase
LALKVETGLLNPEAAQYAGKGQAKPTIADLAAAARRSEALGFDGICAPEAGHDPFLPLAIAAEHTTRISLGTNVAIAFPRSPMVTAQLAWDLQQLSGGRFNLGLGTQVKGHNELRYAAPWTDGPGPRLREYIQCLRAMFDGFTTGEVTPLEGRYYRFSLLPPFFNPGPIDHPRPPITIAAVNTYMAKLGGELGDGLRLHPIATFAYTKAVVLPAVAAGAAKAGRTTDAVNVIGAPFLATGKTEADVERAKKTLKQQIAFYASTRTYHAVLAHHGWEEIGAELHRLSRESKWQELPKLIDDNMLAEWAVIATHDRLASAVRARCEGVFSTVLLDLPRDLAADDDRVRDIVMTLHR